jgi:hypothetical protein
MLVALPKSSVNINISPVYLVNLHIVDHLRFQTPPYPGNSDAVTSLSPFDAVSLTYVFQL